MQNPKYILLKQLRSKQTFSFSEYPKRPERSTDFGNLTVIEVAILDTVKAALTVSWNLPVVKLNAGQDDPNSQTAQSKTALFKLTW